MIHRTYFVNIPTAQRSARATIDICVRATMGTRLLPVADPALYGAGNVTVPPAGWETACGGAAYYELRGRTLRVEQLATAGQAAGYVQRANLGFALSVTPYGGSWLAGAGDRILPCSAQLSASLLEHVGGDVGGAIPATDLADPVYGGIAQPVIRIFAPWDEGGVQVTGLLVVNFDIAERKDEDYDNIGGP